MIFHFTYILGSQPYLQKDILNASNVDLGLSGEL